jgi:hypothetical protein
LFEGQRVWIGFWWKVERIGDSSGEELSGEGVRAERIAEKPKACSHFWGVVPGVGGEEIDGTLEGVLVRGSNVRVRRVAGDGGENMGFGES